jgi:selenocysteine lyase/cysteine desulfurase
MYKNLFARAQGVAYLDTAAEGLLLAESAQAFACYCQAKSRGSPGRNELYEVLAQTRASVGRLLDTDAANVAFTANASDAIGQLILSMDWQAGDQVIVSDIEFSSNVLPWLRWKQRGVEPVMIYSTGGAVLAYDVIERINARTRLILLSLVSYKTGAYLAGLGEISSAAQRVGAVLAIDATQALGRCPVSIDGVDFLFSSSYKWLLGPHGIGIVFVSPEFRRRFSPAHIGWYSVDDPLVPPAALFASESEGYGLKGGAACLFTGMPNFPSIFALKRAVEFVSEIGVEKIHRELHPVVEHLREGLCALGLDVLTPPGRVFASGIVSFAHSDAQKLGESLERDGVIVFAGGGRVRASVHFYNDASDVDRCLEVLARISQTGPACELVKRT